MPPLSHLLPPQASGGLSAAMDKITKGVGAFNSQRIVTHIITDLACEGYEAYMNSLTTTPSAWDRFHQSSIDNPVNIFLRASIVFVLVLLTFYVVVSTIVRLTAERTTSARTISAAASHGYGTFGGDGEKEIIIHNWRDEEKAYYA